MRHIMRLFLPGEVQAPRPSLEPLPVPQHAERRSPLRHLTQLFKAVAIILTHADRVPRTAIKEVQPEVVGVRLKAIPQVRAC